MSPKKFFLAALLLPLVLSAEDKPKITAFERSQGWRLLDGSDLRGFRENRLPKNWKPSDGGFAGTAGTALVTAEEFADFELTFEFKVAAGGHGELYFRATEDVDSLEKSAPKLLLVGHGEQFGGHGLGEPERKVRAETDRWYRVKLALFGNEVTCWINGDRVHGYMLGSPDWNKAVAASAHPAVAQSANERSGRVAFAGEGLEIRNLKARAL